MWKETGRILLGILTVGWLTVAQAQYHLSTYDQITRFVAQRNLTALKSFVAMGNNIDSTDTGGDTALCHAIRRKDYAGFEMLITQGANVKHACVYQITTYDRRAFMQKKPPTGTYYTGFYGNARTAGRVDVPVPKTTDGDSEIGGWLLNGAVVAGAVGGVALAAGGGGGGGSAVQTTNDTHENITPGSTPPNDNDGTSGNPTTPGATPSNPYETKEYTSGRFLTAVNASAAYERDITGYVMQNGAPTDTKVKIGVLDTGVYKHSDLQQNLAGGFNYDYGPCRGGDTTNCWTFYKSGSKSYATLYGADEERKVTLSFSQSEWNEFESGYPDDYDWDETQYDFTPLNGKNHGTHVAGIMVAAKNGTGMHGVAYNAELIPARYDYMSGLSDPTAALINAGARVINYSLSIAATKAVNAATAANITSQGTTLFEYLLGNVSVDAFRYAAQKDTVLVFAAGNNNMSESSIYTGAPLLPEFKDSLKNLVVNVVALNEEGTLTNYSNKCGVTADYCLAAPGGTTSTGIYSTTSTSGNGYMAGTSAAAPVVTGSIALLMGAYPHMSSQQVVDLLFKTATDLGDKETYGHGLINLEAATQPFGTLSLPTTSTVDHNQIAANRTVLTLPAAYAEEILGALPETVAVLDEYDRAFTMDTSRFVRTAHHNPDTFRNALHRFTQHDDQQLITVTPRVTFTFTKSGNVKSTSGIGALDMTYKLTPNHDVRVFFTEDGAYGRGAFFDRVMVNPFSAMDNAYGFENVYRLSSRTHLTMGFSTGENGLINGDEDIDMLDKKQAYTLTGGMDYHLNDKTNLGFVGGVLREEKSMLGLFGAGGFETPDTNTYYMGVTARVKPTEKLTIQAAYYYGLSNPQGHSAFMKTGRLVSDSFAVDARYQLNETDRAGMQISSPLRIRKGNATFDLPVGRDLYNDTVYRAKVTTALKPDAREYDIALYYTKTITPALRMKSQAGVRLNPEHVAGARPDYNMLFSLDWKY